MSFLERHRTICAVLEEIKDDAIHRGDDKAIKLCHEAIYYARRMSAKLWEYKRKEDND